MFQPKSGANKRECHSSPVGFIDAAVDVQVPAIAAGSAGQGRKENHVLVAFQIGDLGGGMLDIDIEADECHCHNPKSEIRNSKQTRKSKFEN
jgi:hypothetical protein